MKHLVVIIIIVISFISISYAQDIHFSMFNQAPLIINPASTGALNGNMRLISNYKNQWESFTSPYKTFSFSGDFQLFANKYRDNILGVGFYFFRDIAGDVEMSTTQGTLSLAYHISLNKHNTLAIGLNYGFGQRSINPALFRWGSQYDGEGFNSGIDSGEILGYENYLYGDFGTGVLWSYSYAPKYMRYNEKFRSVVGLSLLHVNKPHQSYYDSENDRLYSKIVLHGQLAIGLNNTNTIIIPEFVVYMQGPYKEMTVGTKVRYKLQEVSRYTSIKKRYALSLGTYYRLNDAFVALLEYEFSSYTIGISYDINTSLLSAASNCRGGVELFIKFISPDSFRRNSSTPSFY